VGESRRKGRYPKEFQCGQMAKILGEKWGKSKYGRGGGRPYGGKDLVSHNISKTRIVFERKLE